MIEGTPGRPYGGHTTDLRDVEFNLMVRYDTTHCIISNQVMLTQTPSNYGSFETQPSAHLARGVSSNGCGQLFGPDSRSWWTPQPLTICP